MKDYIPYELRTLVTQIEPRLDLDWELALKNIFTKISEADRDKIDKQILQRKSIIWNKEKNTISYLGKYNFDEILSKIPNTNIKTLASKINNSLTQLKSYNDIHQIADYIESVLRQIDAIDVEDSLQFQQTKLEIRKEFIYSCAEIIANKNDITIPENNRNLNIDILKSYISEVFLKQQMFGFRFKTLRPRQLESQSHTIFKDFLKNQQTIRQLEIIKTSKYIFALAPSSDKDINPFSIRRFLKEETFAYADNVYLNGSILDLRLLNDTSHLNSFQWQVSRIVTVEKQISQQVIDLVDSIEEYNSKQLLPFLLRPLDSSGLIMEKVVQQKLWDFEQQLTLNILEPLTDGLQTLVNHIDESDYLFMSMRQLFGDIISYFEDFRAQPAIIFDKQASLFSARLSAYLSLLQKRQSSVFNVFSSDEWLSNHDLMSEPTNTLKAISKESLHTYKETHLEIRQNQRQVKYTSKSFFNNLMNKQKKTEEKMNELKNKAFLIKEKAYLDIVRIPKKYPHLTIYLEFESLISINNKERHYAFPVGNNGVSRLPILVQLPEDRSLFNLQEVCNNLDFDLRLANQKWQDANQA